MGNSQSISLLSYGILEEFTSKSFEEAYPSFSNDSFAQAYLNEVDIPINSDDIDEDVLLDEIVTIISRDAVMRSILSFANIPRPSKKVKIPREVYPRKTSVELWDSIWGKRIKTVREEIARTEVDHTTRDQSEFRRDFRVPFPLFEEIVKECKDVNIFTTGRKKATFADELGSCMSQDSWAQLRHCFNS